MPNYKFRACGKDTRVSKGKYATAINLDITEQRVDVEQVDSNCDNEYEATKISDDDSVKVMDARCFDEIVLDAFDEFNSKSYQKRTNALTTICTQLQLVHNPAFLTKHSHKLLDIIQSALDSNVPHEMDAAASLISLAVIQLPDGNRSFQILNKSLKAIIFNDEYLKTSTRFIVFRAIGILAFLYEPDGYAVSKVMVDIKDIFDPKKSFASKVNRINYESQIAALETWTFLLALLPSRTKCSTPIKPIFWQHSVENFTNLLESPNYSIRVVCAKAIAVIFECGLDEDKQCLEQRLTKIIHQLTDMIGYWNRRTSEIKSPLEVLHYLENGTTPRRVVRNGKCDLDLNNWAFNVQYEMLCNVMGSANVAKHLAKNGKLMAKLSMAQSSIRSPSFSRIVMNDDIQSAKNSSIEPLHRSKTGPEQPNKYNFEKMSKNLELATQKSSMERSKAIEEICQEIHLVPHSFFGDQANVILDIIVKATKRGSETEQLAAVRLAALTVFKFGCQERFCSEVSNLFLNSLKNSSTPISTSASICTALAFIELTANDGDRKFSEPAMSFFRQIFSGTQSKKLKGNSSVELRTEVLEAWALLLTKCTSEDVRSIVKSPMVNDLTEMLMDESNIEFRISCGQVIRLIVERGRISDSNYLKAAIPDINNAIIKEIIDDRKGISSDKRKLQNASLREVLKYLETGSNPSFKLRFAEEIHELKTWSSLFRHQKLSRFIGSNLAIYLTQNERMRAILSIGTKPVIHRFQLQPNTRYKLDSAAKKKSKTKENRLNGRTPKYECL